MKSDLRAVGWRFLEAWPSAVLQAWCMVLCLSVTLSVLRLLQIAWYWPDGLHVAWPDLWAVVFQGGRFDLKVCAAAALIVLPFLLIAPARSHRWIIGTVAVLFVAASLINLHYFGFYKTPIDAVVFGFFADDTWAIVRTIWTQFPVLLTLAVLAGTSLASMAAHLALFSKLNSRLTRQRIPTWAAIAGVLLGMLLLVFATKGTLRAMALNRQNVSVTTSQFLNDMVPNGVMAFKFAWDSQNDSQNLGDPLLGLKRLGFGSPLEAARALGIDAADERSVRASLIAHGVASPSRPRKNLLFFLMESWSAEPFLYHDAKNFDVLGRLAATMDRACHFSNFDSAQPGTHPTLEALLFSTPITPLTLGVHGKSPIPWAIPLLFRQAGYRTLFVTSARSGWRELDRVLKIQGFDEVIDASHLMALYPEATLNIWGVWDSYLFRYLSDRLEQPQDKPLFVFMLTSTNHPPYDLPPEYKRVERDRAKWGGERTSDDLWPNLDTWHYATDLLGAFVQKVITGPLRADTLIAATGDHNVRSFGIYATPERRYLARQVPFVIWGDDLACGPQRKLPASHRDIFPTLFPLLDINQGYAITGRNLLSDGTGQRSPMLDAPISLSYFGPVRTRQGAWTLGDPASFMCTPASAECRFDASVDAQARAELGLLDWNVRSGLRR